MKKKILNKFKKTISVRHEDNLKKISLLHWRLSFLNMNNYKA